MALQVGDWVYCVNVHQHTFGWLGFIEWIRPPECSVIFVRTRSNQPTRQERRMLLRYLEPAGIEGDWTSSELDVLINLALDTRDEGWFRELTARKGGERVDTV